MNQPILRDTIIEIDLGKIAANMEAIKGLIGPDVKIAAVVKADGYGHGALGIAPTLMNHGAFMLAVATLSEALELREAFPSYPILIMGLTPDAYLSYVPDYDLIQTIDTFSQARILNNLAEKKNKKALVHLKYDTGFHRLGFPDTEDSLRQIGEIFKMNHLKVDGIYSHLALTGDEDNEAQFTRFLRAVRRLEERGLSIPCRHMADSIALADYPQYRLDMVRAGAVIYGLKGFHKGSLDIQPALTFKTRISHITEISSGEGVSYDYLWRAPKDTRVATLPFGYADGYPRNLRDKGTVALHGKQVPVIGVICMDQCIIDLTDVPQAKLGDEVIIYGDGNDGSLSIDEVSRLAGTNKNEIVSRLTRRPPRVYLPEKREHNMAVEEMNETGTQIFGRR